MSELLRFQVNMLSISDTGRFCVPDQKYHYGYGCYYCCIASISTENGNGYGKKSGGDNWARCRGWDNIVKGESATATARGFRDYIRLFRAVEHEGWIGDGRTRRDADHSRDTQHNMIEGANESRKDL